MQENCGKQYNFKTIIAVMNGSIEPDSSHFKQMDLGLVTEDFNQYSGKS